MQNWTVQFAHLAEPVCRLHLWHHSLRHALFTITGMDAFRSVPLASAILNGEGRGLCCRLQAWRDRALSGDPDFQPSVFLPTLVLLSRTIQVRYHQTSLYRCLDAHILEQCVLQRLGRSA
jgi:hypothetical protein